MTRIYASNPFELAEIYAKLFNDGQAEDLTKACYAPAAVMLTGDGDLVSNATLTDARRASLAPGVPIRIGAQRVLIAQASASRSR
ncbi:MAG: hypothetical protein J2P17_21895 [Mycobacterium sp.]|nr:hypothetical protein [Mycobacterium sp.]